MSEAPATATDKKAVPDPMLGRVIAERFRIVSLIARGGMGKVYVAEQAPLGRLCAIKILNPNYTGDGDPEFHRRFYREASITSRITHPNSVTIFDYGKTDDDVYYMAMELLEGQTLHQALREVGTMHEERVGRIAQQMCRALREAHALDVIHRDLKPANIFLTRHGDDEDFVKVLDFGLVKHLSERPEEQLTQTGLFMGSPKYMAPEQIQGAVVDARTDVYSLGIMMYEMLAGKVPFERATSVNILMAHVGEPPPPMRTINPNLVCSPAFEDLVMRCIAKDPNERYTNMTAVLNAIKLVHGGAMTGQLHAVNVSGMYAHTVPPPGVAHRSGPYDSRPSYTPADAGQGTAHAQTPANTSGSLTPMGVPQNDHAGTTGELLGHDELPPRRSRVWIGVGVLVAAVLGGLLGMAAFRMTAAPDHAPTAEGAKPVAAAVPSVPEPSATAATAPAPGASDAKPVVLHVTSEPAGANVREDAAELCVTTPCDVTFRGEAAEPGRVHKLTLTHLGYRAEVRAVKAGDPPLVVKLSRASAAGPRATSAPPSATASATSAPTGTAPPSGFKDLPY
ncbi:MAG: Serine/threonine protein kinase PrkC, regulator of stationary phase [Labilithrix sp.]|nr:Serine/threonine protein kinase PrkC, regulator of stationary phase [Labilithrix sp.]